MSESLIERRLRLLERQQGMAKTRTQAERLACAKMRRDGGLVRFGPVFGGGWVLWDSTESLVPDGVRDVHNPKCSVRRK